MSLCHRCRSQATLSNEVNAADCHRLGRPHSDGPSEPAVQPMRSPPQSASIMLPYDPEAKTASGLIVQAVVLDTFVHYLMFGKKPGRIIGRSRKPGNIGETARNRPYRSASVLRVGWLHHSIARPLLSLAQ